MLTKNYIAIHAGGKVVGKVQGDRFIKYVKASKHQLRRPPAWALDFQSLADAEWLGARTVEIIDTEIDLTYTASTARVLDKGFRFNRGFGEQIALPLHLWTVERRDAKQLTFTLGANIG